MKALQRILLLAVLVLTFRQVPASAEFKSQEEFSQFVMNYYRQPDPKAIPAALEYWISTDVVKTEPSPNLHYYDMMAYFFARQAEIDPKLLRQYEKIFAKADKPGRNFFYAVYSIFRDKKTEAFLRKTLSFEEITPVEERLLIKPFLGRDGFVKKVEDYNYLDFLWVEFFITGDTEPVRHIINVLADRDKLRSRLETWLGAERPETEKTHLRQLLSDTFGVPVQFDKTSVKPPVDLDCLLAASLQHKGGDPAVAEIGETLGLDEADFVEIATKGAAFWGLQSNAIVHPKVAAYISEQVKTRSDKAVYELTIIQQLVARKREGK